MRVCYITQAGFDDPGAENTHSSEIVRHLVKAGIEVTVLHPSRSGVAGLGAAECRPRIAPARLLRRVWFQVWLFWILRRAMSHDVIYVRQAAFMLVPALLRRRLGIPIVAEFNTSFGVVRPARALAFLIPLLKNIERRSLKEYDAVITVSSSLREILVAAYGVSPSKITVIHNGTNLELMRPLAKTECRKRLGLPDDAFVVAFVGNLHMWQGIGPLLQAIASIRRENNAAIHLVVAGTSQYLPTFKTQASELGLQRHAHFLGAVPYSRVPEIIGAADVAAAPGDASGSVDYRIRSPLKVYEYLACGRPVVAGDLETIRELFWSKRIGFLTAPGNVTQLARAIETLRSQPNLIIEMGANARRVAEESLSWSAVTDQVVGILRAVATR